MILHKNKRGSAKASLCWFADASSAKAKLSWSLFPVGKRGGADLLVELVLSAIIFFVIVFFLFGIYIPQQQIKACARVVSADAALACETSLNNLLRADSPAGTNYADWLMNSWLNKSTKDWEKDVSGVFADSLGAGDFELQVFLPDGTGLFPKPLGKITTEQLGCNYTIPFPVILLKNNCGYSETQTPITQDVSFVTPDGAADFTIYDDGQLGVDCKETCELDLEPKSIFEERRSNKIPNSAAEQDSIKLPVKIKGSTYELTVEELTPLNTFNVKVTLARSTALQDCGLTVFLKTINMTDTAQTCRGKPVTKVG
jgi:hypothetical protein